VLRVKGYTTAQLKFLLNKIHFERLCDYGNKVFFVPRDVVKSLLVEVENFVVYLAQENADWISTNEKWLNIGAKDFPASQDATMDYIKYASGCEGFSFDGYDPDCGIWYQDDEKSSITDVRRALNAPLVTLDNLIEGSSQEVDVEDHLHWNQ